MRLQLLARPRRYRTVSIFPAAWDRGKHGRPRLEEGHSLKDCAGGARPDVLRPPSISSWPAMRREIGGGGVAAFHLPAILFLAHPAISATESTPAVQACSKAVSRRLDLPPRRISVPDLCGRCQRGQPSRRPSLRFAINRDRAVRERRFRPPSVRVADALVAPWHRSMSSSRGSASSRERHRRRPYRLARHALTRGGVDSYLSALDAQRTLYWRSAAIAKPWRLTPPAESRDAVQGPWVGGLAGARCGLPQTTPRAFEF